MARFADNAKRMIRPFKAMSNTERQREFRRRNPGYYKRLHARRRSALKVHLPALVIENTPVEQKVQLMLPAPVVTVDIPGMTTIASKAIPVYAELSRSDDADVR